MDQPLSAPQNKTRSEHMAIDLSDIVADTTTDNLGFFDSAKHDSQGRGIILFTLFVECMSRI